MLKKLVRKKETQYLPAENLIKQPDKQRTDDKLSETTPIQGAPA